MRSRIHDTMGLTLQYISLIGLVLLGFILGFSLGDRRPKQIKLLLAFSGAFLLGMTFFELVPEIYEHGDSRKYTLLILAGILLQIFLEFFSKGAEHGHIHSPSKEKAFPWILFISLSLHALLEGAPLTEESLLVFALLVHKLPVALLLGILFQRAGFNKWLTFVFALGFSLMSPLGNVLMNLAWGLPYHTEITAISIGILFHVSTVIIFESGQDHRFNLGKLVLICFGFLLSYLL